MSSRLFQSIREERGLAYSVYAYRLAFEGGAPSLCTPVRRPRTPGKFSTLIESEFDRVAESGITEANWRRRGAISEVRWRWASRTQAPA